MKEGTMKVGTGSSNESSTNQAGVAEYVSTSERQVLQEAKSDEKDVSAISRSDSSPRTTPQHPSTRRATRRASPSPSPSPPSRRNSPTIVTRHFLVPLGNTGSQQETNFNDLNSSYRGRDIFIDHEGEAPTRARRPHENLPSAYPVTSDDLAPVYVDVAVIPIVQETSGNDSTQQPQVQISKRFFSRKRLYRICLVILVLVALCFGLLSIHLLRSKSTNLDATGATDEVITNSTIKNTTIASGGELSNSTSDVLIENPAIEDNITSIVDTDSNGQEKDEEEKQEYEVEEKFNSFSSCWNDPIAIQSAEWDRYSSGIDASIPRTFVICPNTTFDVFDMSPTAFEFDFSTGDTMPIVIFDSNVNLICGDDGDIRNNCTFVGGWSPISLFPRNVLVNVYLNNTIENITVQGFKFTGNNGGSSIFTSRTKVSATIKNCHFYNNKQFNTIAVSPIVQDDVSFRIENCTFENNVYTNAPTMIQVDENIRITFAGTGVIASTSLFFSTMSVNFEVHDCYFRNNTFEEGLYGKSFTSAVVNVLPTFKKTGTGTKQSSIKVYNSCFIENKGYTSGLIMGENTSDEKMKYDLQNNFYSDNVSINPSDHQCTLSFHHIIPSEENIFAVETADQCGEDSIPLVISQKERCTLQKFEQ